MRLLPLLTILGLIACSSTGTPTTAGSPTAGSATGGASTGTGGATGTTSSGTGGATGTAGASGTGSGGGVAASSTGASPIGLWLGGSAAVNAIELSLGGDQKLSDSCPPLDGNANPAGASAFDGEGSLWVQYPSETNPIFMWDGQPARAGVHFGATRG
jgi:hypothetical protein